MSDQAAHTSKWEIAEVVFGIPLLIAIVLGFVFPLSLPGGIFKIIFIVAGVGLIVTGVTLIILARREFAKSGQPTDPGRPTTNIVTSGVFSISRNPLYLGATLLVAGIGLTFNLPWVLIILVLSLIACHFVLIAPEERYLTARFGEEYRQYTESVHRWIGRKLNPQ